MKKYLLIFVGIGFSIISFSQKGYFPGKIVTQNSDTIVCLIKQQQDYLNARRCEIIEPGSGKPTSFTPKDIFNYRFDYGKYYVSREVEVDSIKKLVFLEYLVNGIVNLYYYREEAREKYFIEKDGKLIELNNDGKNITVLENKNMANEKIKTYYRPSFQYKHMMTYLFQDSPEIIKRINNTPYSYKSLINLTVDYHNSVCKDRECVNYSRTAEQYINIEPWLGYTMESLHMKTSRETANSTSLCGGINIRLKPFKGYSNWNLLLGFGYGKSNFNGNFDASFVDYSGTPHPNNYDIRLKNGSVKFPLTAEYMLAKGKLRPYISAGIVGIIILDPKPYAIKTDIIYPVPEDPNFSRFHFGLKTGIGIKWEIKDGAYIFLKSDFEYNRPGSLEGWFFDFSRVSSLTASLGYGIRFRKN